jgi:hypothetical protein
MCWLPSFVLRFACKLNFISPKITDRRRADIVALLRHVIGKVMQAATPQRVRPFASNEAVCATFWFSSDWWIQHLFYDESCYWSVSYDPRDVLPNLHSARRLPVLSRINAGTSGSISMSWQQKAARPIPMLAAMRVVEFWKQTWSGSGLIRIAQPRPA